MQEIKNKEISLLVLFLLGYSNFIKGDHLEAIDYFD